MTTPRKIDRNVYRPTPNICTDCGQATTKELPEGRCPDRPACTKRKASWK